MSGSVETQREISPLMTAESSTTITRNGSCRIEVGGGELINATVIIHPIRLKAALLKRYAEGRSAAGSKNQRRPTSWNFAVTMSLSKGFMMYSLAPA
jgi:hypothetical protein